MGENRSNRTPPSELEWRKIKLLALDVDGVLTDGTIFMGPDGFELKQFSVLDGLGLVCLRKAGVILAVISGRLSPATTSRMTELRFHHIIQGRRDKGEALKELAGQLKLAPEEICYVGDNVIDVSAIKYAGIGVTVADGVPLALQWADWTTDQGGGKGAVRQVCDRILESRNDSVLALSHKS